MISILGLLSCPADSEGALQFRVKLPPAQLFNTHARGFIPFRLMLNLNLGIVIGLTNRNQTKSLKYFAERRVCNLLKFEVAYNQI